MAASAAATCFICSQPQTPQTCARPDSCSNHFFHRSCLTELARRSAKCPICSKSFDKIHCHDGTVITIKPKQDSAPEEILAALRAQQQAMQEASVRDYRQSGGGRIIFLCTICRQGGGGERAMPDACNHEFHRSCLNTHTDTDNLCPRQGCRSEINCIRCQFGDRIQVVNPLKAMLSAVAAGGAFHCFLCGENDPMRERALTKPCGHEFHKGCLIERCRHNSTCPRCGSRIQGLNCMLSPDMTVDNSNAATCVLL